MNDVAFIPLRGKCKGQQLKVHQMCNDWVTPAPTETGEYPNGGQPFNLRSVKIPEMFDRMYIVSEAASGKMGQMFRMYFDMDEFIDTGRFKRITR